MGVALVMGVLFSYVMYGAGVAFLLSFFPESPAAFSRARRILAPDALLLLLMAAGLWQFCHQLAAILTERFHALAILDVDTPTLIGLPAPALGTVATAVRSVFSRTALLAVIALAWRKTPKPWMRPLLLLAAAFVMVSSSVRTPGEFTLEYALALVELGCGLLFCIWFARMNYLAYVLLAWLAAMYPATAELIHSGNALLALQGWIVAGVALLAIAWAIAPGLRPNDA